MLRRNRYTVDEKKKKEENTIYIKSESSSKKDKSLGTSRKREKRKTAQLRRKFFEKEPVLSFNFVHLFPSPESIRQFVEIEQVNWLVSVANVRTH